MVVRYTLQAREDLLDIWLYLAGHVSQAIADQMFDAIEKACHELARYPELAQRRPEIAEDARALVIERWLALYRITENGVQIVRILDGARDLNAITWTDE